MENVKIDWKKIYHEINPDGLREWLTTQFPFNVYRIWFEGININVATKDSRTSKMRYITKLNAKALDLIFWLDSKGVSVTTPDYVNNGKIVYDYQVRTLKGKSIKRLFHDRPTALQAGILRAFELLNQ